MYFNFLELVEFSILTQCKEEGEGGKYEDFFTIKVI